MSLIRAKGCQQNKQFNELNSVKKRMCFRGDKKTKTQEYIV